MGINLVLSNSFIYNSFKKSIRLPFSKNQRIIRIEGNEYEFKYLSNKPGSKGGNSNVFLLADPNSKVESDEIIIKICNKPLESSDRKYKRRYLREIIALRKASRNEKYYIVKCFNYGVLTIDGQNFPFYTMEKADYDLANFLNENEISLEQKLLLCIKVIKGFKDLHSLDIYHRDIKHDNLLMFNDDVKICDLGLIRYRDEDLNYEKYERVGAFGWESPEVMNKYLTEKNNILGYDCEVDFQSDIFQLGKLFWYIFQGNLPVGQVILEDFIAGDVDIFNVIFKMLQYSKNQPNRRFLDLDEVESALIPIAKRLKIA